MNTIFKGSLATAAIVALASVSFQVSASTSIPASAGHPYNGTTGGTESYGTITNSGTGLLQYLLPAPSLASGTRTGTVNVIANAVYPAGQIECALYNIDTNNGVHRGSYVQSIQSMTSNYQSIVTTETFSNGDSGFLICNVDAGGGFGDNGLISYSVD